jgi:hypothetical protein
MALGSTQLPKAMSARIISWVVKTAGAYGQQTLHLHVSIVLRSESLSLQELSEPVQAWTEIF